jgi:hypothetical protein
MSDTSPSPKTRKLLAGVAAVVLTLGAAGAAVAVNLCTGAAVETPAGRLTATEPISSPQTSAEITPSSIYVDLTVPVPTESTAAPAPAPVDPSQGGAAAAADPGAAVPLDDSWDDDSDDDWDDHGEDHDDDHDSDEDHDEDHDEGADDDD